VAIGNISDDTAMSTYSVVQEQSLLLTVQRPCLIPQKQLLSAHTLHCVFRSKPGLFASQRTYCAAETVQDADEFVLQTGTPQSRGAATKSKLKNKYTDFVDTMTSNVLR
jgi:hypothetical protein